MSSLTGYLGFDPTDAGSIDASAGLGAFVRSGKSGALITNHNFIENPALSFVFVDGDISANAIAETAHGLKTGDIIRFTTSGTLPSGLALLTDYYAIRINANSFKVAASPQDAELEIPVAITADGSGNHTVTSQDAKIKALDVHLVSPISVELTQADEVTVFQGTSPWVVSGTVGATQSGSWSVDAVQSGAWTVGISGTVAVTQSTSPWTVDGTVELGATTLAALETITVQQGTSPWVIGDGGGSITVDAVDLDIRDLVYTQDSVSSYLFDGTGNAISSSGGALDVNIQSADISLDVENDLADTAIENTSTAVSTSAINVVASALANRKFLALANEGNKILYFGKNGVTTSNGFPLYMREKALFRIGANIAPQIIGAAGASNEDLRVMELS